MRYLLVFFVGCISFEIPLIAQQADSIYSSLKQNPNNLSKIKELAAAADSLASSDPTEAVKLGRHIIDLAAKLNSAEGEAIGYNELGNAFERHSVYDSAFRSFFISYRLFSEINNASRQFGPNSW